MKDALTIKVLQDLIEKLKPLPEIRSSHMVPRGQVFKIPTNTKLFDGIYGNLRCDHEIWYINPEDINEG